jgi:hypothetical protein
MEDSTKLRKMSTWLCWFPPAGWLAEYRAAWLPGDMIAGVTSAAYAIPVSLAYAGLAGLPRKLVSRAICSVDWVMPFSDPRVSLPSALRPPSHS